MTVEMHRTHIALTKAGNTFMGVDHRVDRGTSPPTF